MSISANVDIRQAARKKKVSIWQIADSFGMPETTFYRKLRYEMPAADKIRIMGIIDSIASEESKK